MNGTFLKLALAGAILLGCSWALRPGSSVQTAAACAGCLDLGPPLGKNCATGNVGQKDCDPNTCELSGGKCGVE
jgi:hypothetical protein